MCSSLVSVDATAANSKYTDDNGKDHYALRLVQRKLFLVFGPPLVRNLEIGVYISFRVWLTHLFFLGHFEMLSRSQGAKADAGQSE